MAAVDGGGGAADVGATTRRPRPRRVGGGRGGRGAAAGGFDSHAPALDANSIGGIFRSDNKGASWTLVSNCNARPMYFSQLRVDPQNDKIDLRRRAAGREVARRRQDVRHARRRGRQRRPAHVDQHAIWIDPQNPKHLMIGNDGGLDISWDQGKTWDFVAHDGDGARVLA